MNDQLLPACLYDKLYASIQLAATEEKRNISGAICLNGNIIPPEKVKILNNIAVAELREYLYQLINFLHLHTPFVFSDRYISSFADAICIVRELKELLIIQMDKQSNEELLSLVNYVTDCCNEFIKNSNPLMEIKQA